MAKITQVVTGSYTVEMEAATKYTHQLHVKGDNVGVYNNSTERYITQQLEHYSAWLDPTDTPYASLQLLINDLNSFFFYEAGVALIPRSRTALNYSALPDPVAHDSEIWYVNNQEGTWILGTRKQSGFYESDGVEWFHANDPLQYWVDDQLTFKDDIDNTKQAGFELAGISTGQRRIFSFPDKDGTFGLQPVNVVNVESLSDFPDPIGGYIPLEDATIYSINGTINIGANGLDFGTGKSIKILGNFTSTDQIISTKTGDFIIGTTANPSFETITIINNICTDFFDVSGGGTEIISFNSALFFGTGSIGTLDSFALFIFQEWLLSGFTNGLLFTGSSTAALIRATQFVNCSGALIDLGTSTFDTFEIDSMVSAIATGTTAINVAANGANINAGGQGIITSTNINISAGGDATSGYSPLDLKWNVYGNSESIITSDRITPTGWGYYQDLEVATPTINVTTVPTLLLIDGLGADSESGFLPRAIRGISQLWTSNAITPVVLGDSYDLRVDIEVSAKSGGVAALILQLDIGGGAAPSVVIVERSISVSKTAPFTVSIGFPIFCLATFISNGGQIFVSTDTNSLTIASRAIFVSRNSSGAS